MRIVQLITRHQLRGAEVFARQLASGLADRGHTTGLAPLYGSEDPCVGTEGIESVNLDGRPRSPLSLDLLSATIAFLRSWRPDLIQANGSDTLKYSVLARRLSGVSIPIVYRSISIASAWLRGPVHRAWNRWLARQADHVAAVSPKSARDFAATYGIPPDRITVIPVGTPVPTVIDREGGRSRIDALLARERRGPVILHAASFTPEKDHYTLLGAFARVARQNPETDLVLAGDGPLRPRVLERIEALGLADRVAAPGVRADLSDLMAGADLFVLSSRIEGLPGVLLEAAAAGVPIVATNVGSVGDVVLEGRTGLLVPPGEPQALADAMETLIDDPERSRAYGAEGREHVRRNYELGRIVDRFEELYRDLVEARNG